MFRSTRSDQCDLAVSRKHRIRCPVHKPNGNDRLEANGFSCESKPQAKSHLTSWGSVLDAVSQGVISRPQCERVHGASLCARAKSPRADRLCFLVERRRLRSAVPIIPFTRL